VTPRAASASSALAVVRRAIISGLFAFACLSSSRAGFALDKQGSAHGGEIAGADSGFDISGSGALGIALYNPTYAARPDNTGVTLMRYAGHADVDLIGRKLSIPLDVNLFSDRLRSGAKKLAPTELDLIGGVTTTWPVGPSAVELGVRYELDSELQQASASERARNGDIGCNYGANCSQSYVDVRARYLYALSAIAPAPRPFDVSGYATLGLFAYNKTYAARPDNSGLALFRYALHDELSFADGLISIGLDATFFTDRRDNAVLPCELDLTPEVVLSVEPFDFHLAYERDMPLGKSAADENDLPASQRGLVQSILMLSAGASFDLALNHPKTAPHRTPAAAP